MVLVVFCYFLLIYFDFSGYSDMAIGISNLLGIEMPENFEYPYKSHNITEFWRRWHITLNVFLTQYIYVPLGGNRKGFARTCINIIIIFLISGLWHGPKWTFVLWGLANGMMVVIEKCLQKYNVNLPSLISIPFVSFFTNLSWVLFRSNSVLQANDIYKKIFSFNGLTLNNGNLLENFALPELKFVFRFIGIEDNALLFFIIVFVACVLVILFEDKINYKKNNILVNILTIVLLVWCTLSFSNTIEFIYAGF